MAKLDWYIRANLKPRHLQLLVAVDDLRHLGRVAAALHVSQPAVSLALTDLEKGLGLTLFERTPRGVVPNDYGECLVRHARGLLRALADAGDELHALRSGSAGKVSVGALPAVTPGLIPQALERMKSRSPQTRVVVQEGAMETLLPELRRGSLDMVVGRLVPSEGAGDLADETLDDGTLVLLVGSSHPLARRRRMAWAELVDYPWVLPPVGSLQREPLEEALLAHDVPVPADIVETLSIPVITSYLHARPAIGMLSRLAARRYVAAGELRPLPLALPAPRRPIGMMWSRHARNSPAMRMFQECLRQAAAG